MARRVTIDDLAATIQDVLDEYGKDVAARTEEAVKKVAKAGAQAVSTSASEKLGGSGTYAGGWTSRVETDRLKVTGVIYNKDRPGLAHLLEKGHVTRNGTGRTIKPTPAHVHIAPIEEKIAEDFEKAVKVELT